MALTLEVKNAEGKKVGSVDLPSEIFDAQTNIPLIHQVVTAQLAAARQGTQKAKNRGETSGSGKKPFKQALLQQSQHLTQSVNSQSARTFWLLYLAAKISHGVHFAMQRTFTS